MSDSAYRKRPVHRDPENEGPRKAQIAIPIAFDPDPPPPVRTMAQMSLPEILAACERHGLVYRGNAAAFAAHCRAQS